MEVAVEKEELIIVPVAAVEKPQPEVTEEDVAKVSLKFSINPQPP